MVVEFRQDCLDQMLSGFLQFPYQETHRLKTKQSCSKLASAEGKQDYIMKDMASMAKRFASWDALRVSYVTSSTEGSPIYQRKAPHFLS
jgi:hypothetical protein